jgi:hypothetical protein
MKIFIGYTDPLITSLRESFSLGEHESAGDELPMAPELSGRESGVAWLPG